MFGYFVWHGLIIVDEIRQSGCLLLLLCRGLQSQTPEVLNEELS